jgi:endonuclease/exonuclease/phosphatase family metal-dependent hydrolase
MGRQSIGPFLLALGVSACATARNYTSVEGPRFDTRHGIPEARLATTVRVVTFNIKFGEKIDSAIDALAGSPRLRDLDILTLQEMDAEGVARIAEALSLNSVYFPSAVHPKSGRDFGNAVLSPWPIDGGRKVRLPYESRGQGLQRSATAATVLVGGRRVEAYSVHIETPFRLGGEARREQLHTVLDDARRVAGPVVIAGDMNSRGISTAAEEKGFLWTTRDVRNTAGWLDLDHVFVRGLVPSGPAAAGVAENEGASDHRPVWTDLTLVD